MNLELILCQPIAALEHPSFKKMINVVALATNGIKTLGHKYTRILIINTFKEHMVKLRPQLLVSQICVDLKCILMYSTCL
jgi:hypothetical protein